jgi:hypothetical protein
MLQYIKVFVLIDRASKYLFIHTVGCLANVPFG